MDRLEGEREEYQEVVDGLEKGVAYSQEKLKNLAREVEELRRMAREAKDQAAKVARTLELKEQEEAAEARARGMVAKWVQIALGALVLIGTIWSGKLLTGVDQLRALLR